MLGLRENRVGWGMTDQEREQLALRMVTSLPRFGLWATAMRDFETPFGKLGFRQMAILWSLRYDLTPGQEMTPSKLAELNGVQPSVITRALDKLEHGGFITRAIDQHDHRSFHIVITQKGKDVGVYVERLYIDDITGSMAALDDDQIAELARNVEIIDDIVTNLEAQRGASRLTGRGEA